MMRHRLLRAVLVGLVGLIALTGTAFAVWVARFGPNAYKPRIEEAVYDATGRDLTLNGPIRLSLFPLGITLRDVALSNPPGFANARMATVRQITLRLDFGPLLRRQIVVRQLDIDQPDIGLERNASGLPNWVFAPPGHARVQASALPQAGSAVPESRQGGGVAAAVLDARISGGVLSYRDARSGQAYSLSIPTLAISAASPDAPIHLEGQAVLANTSLLLNADAGPPAGFSRGAFWPLRVSAKAAGQGMQVALELTAPAANQPIRATMQGSVRDTPFAATASLGTPSALAGTGQPLPLSVETQAAGAKLTLSGTVARPMQMAGVDTVLSAQVPDLAALSALAGRSLPKLRDLAIAARLTDLNGLRSGVALRALRVAAAPGDAAGVADVLFAPRPSLRADLTSTRLDLAALRAAMPPALVPPPPAAAPPTARNTPVPTGPVIPDTPIPFGALRGADTDLRLRIGTLNLGAEALRAVDAHLGLASGALSFSGQGAFGAAPVALTMTADAHDPPNVALALNAPALPFAALLTVMGQPPFVAGTMTVTANLHGSGASPHALAASLDGVAAATMRGGTIETQVLERALGPVIARANPLGALGGGAQSELRCLVARARASHGRIELAPLLLASPLLTVDGSGRVDLATETLDLHLNPRGRAGGVSFSVPVTVTGGFRAPRFRTSEPAAAAAGLQTVLGVLAGKAGLGAAPAGPSCDAALAAARG